MESTAPVGIVGRNIRLLRERIGLTQEALAGYLGVKREIVAYYESGTRNITSVHLARLADLFCVDEYDFFEEDERKSMLNMAFAFRATELTSGDLESMARFKRVVRNYVHMVKALGDE